MARPTSATITCRSIRTVPSSGSTVTSHAWHPLAWTSPAVTKSAWAASRPRAPSANAATSNSPTPRSVPATVKRPPAYITSAAAASSIRAARARPSSTSFCALTTTAPPPTRADREPWEPAPRTTRSVSPKTTSTQSNGTPSVSAAICENTVAWPMPKSWVPAQTITRPSPVAWTSANSVGVLPSFSTYIASPNPRSAPRARLAARRAGKPLQSASSSARSKFSLNAPDGHDGPARRRPRKGLRAATMFRRRSSIRSIPVSRAAASIRLSVR